MNSCNCKNGLVPVNEPFFCPKLQAYVVRGPRGETGAQGPQGPQGLNGIINNNITLATPQELGVVSQGAIVLSQIVAQNGNALNFVAGESSGIIGKGTYLVVYNLSLLNSDAENKSYNIAFVVGGEVQSSMQSSVTVAQNETVSLGGNGIITVENDETFALMNNSSIPAEISNLVLSIVKLM